jgi:hypothetical protein
MILGSTRFGEDPIAFGLERYRPEVAAAILVGVTAENVTLPAGTQYNIIDQNAAPILVSVGAGGYILEEFRFAIDSSIAVSVTSPDITVFTYGESVSSPISSTTTAPDITIFTYGEVVSTPISVAIVLPTDYGDRLSPIYLWDGYSSNGTNITIPIAQLPGLSAAEADAVTGDWREILQAILTSSLNHSKLYVKQSLVSQLDTYSIYRLNLYGRTTNSHFTVKFLTDMGEPNVAPEP